MVESGNDIKYKLHFVFEEIGNLNEISSNDFILVFKRGLNFINYVFKVKNVNFDESELLLEKVLETNNEIIIEDNEIIEKLQHQEILKISEKQFTDLYGKLLNNLKLFESEHIPFDEGELESNRICCGNNTLLYGVPGAGKSWHIKNVTCKGVDEDCIERVVFHPDYTYSDFVGQILPKVSDQQVKYEFVCGPFTSILRQAYKNPNKMFYLIIEEINRGNAPAIFGDIFQLLDRMDVSKDGFKIGTSEFPITNSDIGDKVYHDKDHKIRLPSNLTIVATMNTSDQNVFTLDTAFQRRWDMEMIENEIDDDKNQLFKETFILDTALSWKNFCYGINKKILETNNHLSSSEDKRMGTYFIKAETFDLKNKEGDEDYHDLLEKQTKKFSEKILKYLWDDAFKFSRDEIFNEEKYGSLDLVIKEFNSRTGKERFNVFKDGLYDELINIDFSIGYEKGE